jgi:uncharacterized protein YndB with AHSA1/START domain
MNPTNQMTPPNEMDSITRPTTRDIELSVELDASPEDVFRAVTDGTEIAKWLAPEARVTPPTEGKKGRIFVSWGEGMGVEKPIEIWDAPRRTRHASGENPETKAPLWVDWYVEAKAGGTTTLRLVHSGFSASAEWDDEFDSHARGWRLMLANLRHYFARHAKKPAVHLTFMTKVDSPRADVWSTLLSKLAFRGTPESGDAFRITIAGGDVLTGTIDLVNPARDLGLVVHELDDALLRFTLEGGAKSPGAFVFGYVIAFGDADRTGPARELASKMASLVEQLG